MEMQTRRNMVDADRVLMAELKEARLLYGEKLEQCEAK